jgi:hypothetical protein
MFAVKKAPLIHDEIGEPSQTITAGAANWHRDARSESEFPRRAALARRILVMLFEPSGKPN